MARPASAAAHSQGVPGQRRAVPIRLTCTGGATAGRHSHEPVDSSSPFVGVCQCSAPDLQQLGRGRAAIARGAPGLHRRRSEFLAGRTPRLGAGGHQSAHDQRRSFVDGWRLARRVADWRRRDPHGPVHQHGLAQPRRPHHSGPTLARHDKSACAQPRAAADLRSSDAQPRVHPAPPWRVPHRGRS